MGINPFSNITTSVAQDTPFGRFIGSGIIKQRCNRMAAVVSSMTISFNGVHDASPELTIPAVVVRPTFRICYQIQAGGFHTVCNKRENPMMDRDGADAGNGLALGNPDISLAEVHISLLYVQHLTDTHAGVKQNEHRINTGLIAVDPE